MFRSRVPSRSAGHSSEASGDAGVERLGALGDRLGQAGCERVGRPFEQRLQRPAGQIPLVEEEQRLAARLPASEAAVMLAGHAGRRAQRGERRLHRFKVAGGVVPRGESGERSTSSARSRVVGIPIDLQLLESTAIAREIAAGRSSSWTMSFAIIES